MAIKGVKTVLMLVAAAYFFVLQCSVVGQTTYNTSSNSTNNTIRVCNGTILIITLPTGGIPWYFGYPQYSSFPQQFGLPRRRGPGRG